MLMGENYNKSSFFNSQPQCNKISLISVETEQSSNLPPESLII